MVPASERHGMGQWSQGPRLVGLGNRRPGLVPPLRQNGRADKAYHCPRPSRRRREPVGSQGAERDGKRGIQRRALAWVVRYGPHEEERHGEEGKGVKRKEEGRRATSKTFLEYRCLLEKSFSLSQ